MQGTTDPLPGSARRFGTRGASTDSRARTAWAETLQHVFAWVVPVALLALALLFFLPQVPMRDTAKDAVRGPTECFAMPDETTSEVQLETIIGRILRRQDRGSSLARALSPAPAEGTRNGPSPTSTISSRSLTTCH